MLEKITHEELAWNEKSKQKTKKGGNLRNKQTKRNRNAKYSGGKKQYIVFHVIQEKSKIVQIYYEPGKIGTKSDFTNKDGV